MIPNNASPLRITAAAGTELAGASSAGTVKNPKIPSFLPKGLYIPRYFITHAALLGQAFAHCQKFPTAASRRSLNRVSVPVWPCSLSGRLLIVALVSCYPTNKLIRRGPLIERIAPFNPRTYVLRYYAVLALLSEGYSPLNGRLSTCYSPVRHSTCPLRDFRVRLACVRHAASVDSEPGSNSH